MAVLVLVIQAGIARLRRKTICKTVSSGVTRRCDVRRQIGRVPSCITYLLNVIFRLSSRLPLLPAGLPFGLRPPFYSSCSLAAACSLAHRTRVAANRPSVASRVKRETREPARFFSRKRRDTDYPRSLFSSRDCRKKISSPSPPPVTTYFRRIPSPSRMERLRKIAEAAPPGTSAKRSSSIACCV